MLVIESNFIGARKITQSIIAHNKLTDVIHIHDSCDSIPKDELRQVRLIKLTAG